MISSKEIYFSACNSQNVGHQLTERELQALQSHLFRMYRDLEAVCKRHNLRICLAYGNVLGVMRHGGWIPWDDDLDVHMPREDYDKLLNEYVDELPSKYRVYAPHTQYGPSYRFAKMVDTSTTFVPLGESKERSKYYPGVFVDIFPVENISKNKFVNAFRKYVSFFLSYTATSVEITQRNSKRYKELMCSSRAGKNNYYFRKIWGNLFSFASTAKWFCWIDKFNQHKEKTGYVHVPTTIEKTSWQPLPESMFFPGWEVPFGKNGTALVPGRCKKDTEEYLTLRYGEWRIIPSADKIWHHYINEIELPELHNEFL